MRDVRKLWLAALIVGCAETSTDPLATRSVVVTGPANSMPVLSSAQLTAVVYLAGGVPDPTAEIAWSSNRPAVADVSTVGLVFAPEPAHRIYLGALCTHTSRPINNEANHLGWLLTTFSNQTSG